MNRPRDISLPGLFGSLLLLAVFLFAGCTKGKAVVPDISDEPVEIQVAVKYIAETVPAYGIVAGRELEVNVEKEDAPKVMIGQKANALVGDGKIQVECRVVNLIRDVNTATGMAIAWLKPVGEALPLPGEFVSAGIILKVKHHVLAVPQEAVYVRDGQSMVLVKKTPKEGGVAYVPTSVQTGLVSGTEIEIVSGLRADDWVTTQAGIGYLYPDFKANAGD